MRTRWTVFFVLLTLWAVITAGLFTSSYFTAHSDAGMARAGIATLLSYVFGAIGAMMLMLMAVLNWCL